jgi:hypothetical protein
MRTLNIINTNLVARLRYNSFGTTQKPPTKKEKENNQQANNHTNKQLTTVNQMN